MNGSPRGKSHDAYSVAGGVIPLPRRGLWSGHAAEAGPGVSPRWPINLASIRRWNRWRWPRKIKGEMGYRAPTA